MIKKCLYEKDCSSLSFVPRRNNVSERGRFDNGLQLSCLSCFENGIQIDGGRVFVYSQPQFVANRQLQRGNEKFALQLREILQCKILSEGTSWRKTVFCPGSGRLVSLYERFELCLESGVPEFDVKKALINEQGKVNRSILSDTQLCDIIDNKLVKRYFKDSHESSIYLLSERQRANIGNLLWADKNLYGGKFTSTKQIKRCLAL